MTIVFRVVPRGGGRRRLARTGPRPRGLAKVRTPLVTCATMSAPIVTSQYPTRRHVAAALPLTCKPVNGKGSDLPDAYPAPWGALHRVSSLFKRWLLGTTKGSVHPDHRERYLDEYVFSFNRRNSRYRGLLFQRLLAQAVQGDPRTPSDLLGNRALRAVKFPPSGQGGVRPKPRRGHGRLPVAAATAPRRSRRPRNCAASLVHEQARAGWWQSRRSRWLGSVFTRRGTRARLAVPTKTRDRKATWRLSADGTSTLRVRKGDGVELSAPGVGPLKDVAVAGTAGLAPGTRNGARGYVFRITAAGQPSVTARTASGAVVRGSLRSVRGHVKVLAGGQRKSPLVANRKSEPDPVLGSKTTGRQIAATA